MSATAASAGPVHSSHPTSPRISPIRLIFSFPAAIASLLAVLATCTVRSRFDDPDLWLHLKTGQIVWTTRAIPTTDTFSYTTGHAPTLPHEWLAQTLIYGAYRLGGYSGLMLWLCVAASLVLIAGYFLCSIYSGNAKVSFAGALMVWAFAAMDFSLRPQMIGYLLLIAELLVLHLGRTRDKRYFYALPPLFAIWVNIHGSFSLGLAMAGIVLGCAFIPFEMGLVQARRWERGAVRAFAASLGLSLLALLLNPVGLRLALYPIRALGGMTVGGSAVSEWQPLALGDPRALGVMAVVAAIGLLVILRGKAVFLDELLFVAAATYLAAGHRRLAFAFGILVAPVLCRLIADAWDNYVAEQDRPTANAVLMALAIAVCWLAFPSRKNLAAQVTAGSPVDAVKFIEGKHLAGPMLNDWVTGGYLVWAAPDHPVFIDGRGDPYDQTGVTQQFGDWATLRADPRILLDKYRIAFCLLSRGAPMSYVLPLVPGWKLAYSDPGFLIFQRIP